MEDSGKALVCIGIAAYVAYDWWQKQPAHPFSLVK
jgi:hypothetical protein